MSAAEIVHDFGLCTSRCDHDALRADEIEVCRAWIRERAMPRATINRRLGSYQLKHAVEHESAIEGVSYIQTDRAGRRWIGAYRYVSNGAFITAAILEGYRVVRVGDGPNAVFNMQIRKRTVH